MTGISPIMCFCIGVRNLVRSGLGVRPLLEPAGYLRVLATLRYLIAHTEVGTFVVAAVNSHWVWHTHLGRLLKLPDAIEAV